jgi:hypothetical protein
LRKSSHVVQGVSVNVLCENQLDSFVSSCFNSLYRGEERSEIKPSEFELYIVGEPPPVPAGSARMIKTPFVTSYSNGEEIYFTSEDGSIICLNSNTRNAKGFIKKEILSDPIRLFSLIGFSIAEVLKYHNLYFLHSAALYRDGTGYLISGDGGCGKTTTSLSLVREGFKYASDDSLFIKEQNGEIVVCPLYTSFHIDQDLVERFPEIVGGKGLPIPDGVKVSVDISQVFPGSFISYMRPDVIIFPRINSKGESQLHPISRMEVYRRLLKQTVLAADKVVSRNQIRALEKLVKQTVGFELLSGSDIYEDSKRLIGFISQINGLNGNHKKGKV